MQKIKKILLFGAISCSLLFYLGLNLAYAQSPNPAKNAIQQGACDASGQANCNTQTATNSLNDTIATAINIISVIVGIVAVIMIIVAGFRYVTSGGDTESVASAKKTLLYAVIGLIVVALAQTIVRFVLKRATGS